MISAKRKVLTLLLAGFIFIGCNSSKRSDDTDETTEPPLLGNPITATFKTLYEYSPFIKPIAGLGYAVYQNDGEFNTGLVMTVLNPEGTILENQEYEVSLLKEMKSTLVDMQNQLNEIGSQLNEILSEIGLAKAEILTNINDPSENIDNIGTISERLYLLAQKYDPHDADQEELDEQADAILSPFSNYYILGELNHVHSAVIASSAGKTPLLSTFTDQLIIGLGATPTSNDLINAYKSLEYYTMQLIGAEVQATNLLVDASLYKGDSSGAENYYKKLNDNLEIFFNTDESYSFTYNALRLVLRYVDSYYDKPGESGSFFVDRSIEIFERMAFLKNITLGAEDKSMIVVYKVSENSSEAEKLYAMPLPDPQYNELSSTWECDASEIYAIPVPSYDHWSRSATESMELNLASNYKVTEYKCGFIRKKYTYYIMDGSLNVYDTIIPIDYNDGMEESSEGEYTFGFGTIVERDSAGFEQMTWSECTDRGYLREELVDDKQDFFDIIVYLDDSDYHTFLKDPLDGIFMITQCDDVPTQTLLDISSLSSEDSQDCEVSSAQVYDMITMCSNSFTYIGSEDEFGINTRLYRKYLADAQHGGFSTDGTIYLGAGLFFEDITSGDSDTIYEKTEKTRIQGEEYMYSNATTYHKTTTLKNGHEYRFVVQMAAKIDQGLSTTKGFVSIKLEKERKIRFMYPSSNE